MWVLEIEIHYRLPASPYKLAVPKNPQMLNQQDTKYQTG